MLIVSTQKLLWLLHKWLFNTSWFLWVLWKMSCVRCCKVLLKENRIRSIYAECLEKQCGTYNIIFVVKYSSYCVLPGYCVMCWIAEKGLGFPTIPYFIAVSDNMTLKPCLAWPGQVRLYQGCKKYSLGWWGRWKLRCPTHVFFFVLCHYPEDGLNRLSWNFSKKLPPLAA